MEYEFPVYQDWHNSAIWCVDIHDSAIHRTVDARIGPNLKSCGSSPVACCVPRETPRWSPVESHSRRRAESSSHMETLRPSFLRDNDPRVLLFIVDFISLGQSIIRFKLGHISAWAIRLKQEFERQDEEEQHTGGCRRITSAGSVDHISPTKEL